MLRTFRIGSTLLAALSLLALVSCGLSEPGFEPIFDGRTLAGWRAVPEADIAAWSVVEGTLQAKGLEDRQSYLVYARDEALTDFELQFSYRMLTDGNTGVELRARPDHSGKRPFEGYHADLGHVGIGAHILGAWDFHFATRTEFPCPRGTRLRIDESGAGHPEAIDDALELADIKKRDWNQCLVVAKGNRFEFFVNGKLSSAFTDGIARGRLDSGAIALQIHEKGTEIAFRDILLKRLDPAPAAP